MMAQLSAKKKRPFKRSTSNTKSFLKLLSLYFDDCINTKQRFKEDLCIFNGRKTLHRQILIDKYSVCKKNIYPVEMPAPSRSASDIPPLLAASTYSSGLKSHKGGNREGFEKGLRGFSIPSSCPPMRQD